MNAYPQQTAVNSGYEPPFDLQADPETIKFLAFGKDLEPHG